MYSDLLVQMPIEALPESTIRAIGSTLVLNDAKTVIKELVDNALDARATAISVEISQNTLDVIQVKDNGTGIGVQDRQLLCKRGCTSKIRSLDDLYRLGGSFLGFRGEALASIAEISNAVTITTRVDGELVGTALTFGASGMLSSSSASHPVGTTFRVQNFLQKIPVRKQTAVKSAPKTLQTIKALLFAFAFARPETRFSLKVLKAKNDNGNWTYAPSTNNLLDVASKVVGKDTASHCVYQAISSTDFDTELDEGWTVEALVASHIADAAKIRNAPQYVSIDGRPVTSDRGTVKDILKLYKRYLQAAHASVDKSSLSRPFLCLQIKCPSESYDVNIEPAKDEVLFFRPTGLLSLMEALFARVYGDPGSVQRDHDLNAELSEDCSPTKVTPLEAHQGTTNQLQNKTDNEIFESDNLLGRVSTSNPFTIAAMNARVIPRKMDSVGASTIPSATPDQAAVQKIDQDHAVTPQVTTHLHRTPLGQKVQLPSPSASPNSTIAYQNPGPPVRRRTKLPAKEIAELGVDSRPLDEERDGRQLPATRLQTWLTPSSSDRRPVNQRVQTAREALHSLNDSVFPGAPTLLAQKQSNTSPRGTSHHPSLRWGPGQKPFRSPVKRSPNGQNGPVQSPISLQDLFDLSERTLRQETPQAVSPEEVGHESRTCINTPGRISLGTQRQTSTEPTIDTRLTMSTELEDIMDFEHRKKAVIAQQRRFAAKFPSKSVSDILKSSRAETAASSAADTGILGSIATDISDVIEPEDFEARFSDASPAGSKHSKSNPHHNRYLAAVRHLSHSNPRSRMAARDNESHSDDNPTTLGPSRAESIPPSLSNDDPRAYLIKQQQKGGTSKLYRTKSSKLPLESIPANIMTLHLVRVANDFQPRNTMRGVLESLAAQDRYILDGKIENPDLTASLSAKMWKDTIRELIKARYRSEDGEDMRTKIDDVEISFPRGAS